MAAQDLTIARIVRLDNLVVNIESATQEWLDENTHDPFFYWMVTPDKDGNGAVIGLHFDPKTGLFEQPPAPEKPTAKGGKKK